MRSKMLVLVFALVFFVSLAAFATPATYDHHGDRYGDRYGPDVNAWNHPDRPDMHKETFHGAEMTPGAMLLAGLLGVATYLGMRHYSRRHA